MKILAVDDDIIIRNMIPTIFRSASLKDITVAESGAQALDLIDSAEPPFDCLLCDIAMPGMNGIELVERIRARPAYARTPIIMLTAVIDMSSIEQAFIAGANDYVTKPFEIKDVISRVLIADKTANTLKDGLKGPYSFEDRSAQDAIGHPFAVDEEIRIKNIDCLIESYSLGNYVAHLSRDLRTDVQVFGVQIDNIEDIYATTATSVFCNSIAVVTDALTDLVVCRSLLISYIGNGRLLCVVGGAETKQLMVLEEKVQTHLSCDGIVDANDPLLRLKITLCNPLPPCASRTQRVKKTFDRVLARLDAMTDKKRQHRSARG